MYIKTLGEFAILGLEGIKFSDKEKEIISYIAIKSHEGYLSRERLLEDIWYFDDKYVSNKRLSVYLTKINKKIKKLGRIFCKDSKIKFFGEKIECDAKAFEKNALNFLENKDYEYGEKAISIYKGSFLEGVYNVWVENFRNTYEVLFFDVIYYLISLTSDYLKKSKYLLYLTYVSSHEKMLELIKNAKVFDNKENLFVPYDFAKFLLEKNFELRDPIYIPIYITLENSVDISRFLRKGDVLSKKDNNTFLVLLEKNHNISMIEQVTSFLKRLEKSGIEVKHFEVK
ncbi:hypothetical protein HNP65_001893 [Thermosipho japonicus]|uniref:Uncharacterized protein n=1 Tax=Thermosipho japonicus TaxID=90323 RepID=A0A841GIG1_9BACT|nr:hypothetical protein [Thermosipho japonicus]MBB6063422.1 hypothetical protein [Thermosipho japonicus]